MKQNIAYKFPYDLQISLQSISLCHHYANNGLFGYFETLSTINTLISDKSYPDQSNSRCHHYRPMECFKDIRKSVSITEEQETFFQFH